MPVLLANAKADASGKATITFPAPGQGMAYCGTVIVPSTPGAATWTAVIGNATYGQWSGATSAGPFTENDQETLQLKGEGLTPGTTYVATWHITQGAAGSFRGVTPDVLPASVNITNASIKVAGSIDANITNASIPVTGSVTVESGSIDIGNTPSVTVDTSGGSVPVDATGTVTVASITDPVSVGGTLDVQGVAGGTAIGVAGSVDIGNTPTVTVESGSVDIANSPSVTITSGAVDATIQNATLDVTGSNVTVENASGSTLQTIVLGQEVGSGSWTSALATQQATVSIGTARTLVVGLTSVSGQAADTLTLSAVGVQSGISYLQDVYSQYNASGNASWVIAVIPNMDTEVTFYVYSPAGGAAFTADWTAWGDPEPVSTKRFDNPASLIKVIPSGGQSFASVNGVAANATGSIIDAPGAGYCVRLQRAILSVTTGNTAGTMSISDSSGMLAMLTTPTANYSANDKNLDGLLCADNSAVSYGNGTGKTATLYLRYDVIRTPYFTY